MMKFKRVILFLLIICFLSMEVKAETILQTVRGADNHWLQDLTFSGYLRYYWYFDVAKDGDETNGLEIDEAVISLEKEYGGWVTIRVETSVEKTPGFTAVDSGGDTVTGTPDEEKYDLYLKYGYVQFDKKNNFASFNLKAGMIPTPVETLLNGLSDQLWVHDIGLEQGGKITPGAWNLDNLSDSGISMNLNLSSVLNFTTAITSGEGYKNVEEDYKGKAYYGLLDITPVKEFHIYGFTRYNYTTIADDTQSGAGWTKNYQAYVGGGFGWSDDFLKIGLYYLHPYGKDHGDDILNIDGESSDLHLVDSWINLDFKTVAGMPLLIYTRYALGRDSNRDNGNKYTSYYSAGVGYGFHQRVKGILFYDLYQPEKGDNQHTVYLKMEAGF